MIGPLAYVGGKRRIAKRLIELFPPHVTYIELFAGGAQVFFHKAPSRVEVLNDLDADIVTFLRVCQHHPQELLRTLAYLVPSRALFAQLAAQAPATLTDIQRAARFLYLQKNAFGGQVRRRTFHTCVVKAPNYNLVRLPAIIESAARRLARVQVEQLPYQEVLERYDRPTTFFYIDPPYIARSLYRFNFTETDFHDLADRLSRISGRFLLSINDHPLARQLFAPFECRTISFAYTASRRVPTVSELIVSNYATSAYTKNQTA